MAQSPSIFTAIDIPVFVHRRRALQGMAEVRLQGMAEVTLGGMAEATLV